MKKESKLRSLSKRGISIILALAMVLTLICVAPSSKITAQAATSKDVYINPFSDRIQTYMTGDKYTSYSSIISIVGCTKKSQIKNLKSSNKNIKVSAQDGYIRVVYGDKAGTAKITCTVRGVKLKTTFTVKKYTNPISKLTVGGKNYTSKFAKTNRYYYGKKFSNKKFSIKVKSGWKIKWVSTPTKTYYMNKSSWSKTVSMKKYSYSYISVGVYQEKTGVYEYLYFNGYKY